jgi:hypothetical protein
VLDRAVAHTLTFVTVAPGCQSEISPKCPESLALLFWPYRFDLEACAHQARRGGANRNESAADTLEAARAID